LNGHERQDDMRHHWNTYLSILQMEFMTLATLWYIMDVDEISMAYAHPGNFGQQALGKSQVGIFKIPKTIKSTLAILQILLRNV